MRTLKSLLSVLPVALLVACADPAENVPSATVNAQETESQASKPSSETRFFVITPENSKIEWIGSKVTGSHEGGFKQFQGEVHVSEGAVAHAKVTIDTTSLHSDNDRLTSHLKSPDFFDAEKFPTAVFESTSVSGQGTNTTVTGNLTLHGITKQISFPALVEVKEDAAIVKAEFSINRFDFEMKYAGKADDLIRDKVVLRLDVKATPKQG